MKLKRAATLAKDASRTGSPEAPSVNYSKSVKEFSKRFVHGDFDLARLAHGANRLVTFVIQHKSGTPDGSGNICSSLAHLTRSLRRGI